MDLFDVVWDFCLDRILFSGTCAIIGKNRMGDPPMTVGSGPNRSTPFGAQNH